MHQSEIGPTSCSSMLGYDTAGQLLAVSTNCLYAAGGDAAWGQKSGADMTRRPGGVSWD